MTKVVNKYKEPFDVYIGRGSVFGNPYSIGEHGSREEVIALFKTYLWGRMNTSPSFCGKLMELEGKTLGCFCKPQACHGDVIVAAIKYMKGVTHGHTKRVQ